MSILLYIGVILFFILGYILFLQKLGLSKLKEIIQTERNEKEEKISELTRLQSEIHDNYTKDELTGLYTQKVFKERISKLLEGSKNYKLFFALILIDIDRFRMLNTALGREVGDKIIKELAERLYNNIRKLDMVCHFAGDQFAILLTPLSKPEMTSYIVERLRSVIVEPFHIDEKEIYITTSMGIVLYPSDGDSLNTLLLHADEALLHAKLSGVNQFQFFKPSFREKSCREIALASSLRSNKMYEDFYIYYQPIFNVSTGVIYSIEAILFWQHATYGLIEFADFMHLAEMSGSLVEMGDWLIQHAFLGFKQLQPFLQEKQSLTISIGARQLENPHFIYQFTQLLKNSNIEPTRLVFDIPECSLFDNNHIIGKTVAMMKKMGIKFGISHFGNANISWQILSKLPISHIKFSKLLMKDIEAHENVVKLMIAFANTLGLQAMAAGVMNADTVQILKSLGCQIMQGDFLGEPLQLEQLLKNLQKSGVGV